MRTFTVEVSEETAEALEKRAERLGVGVDDLVREGLVQILSRDDEEFLRASEYVLSKNKELYQRLS